MNLLHACWFGQLRIWNDCIGDLLISATFFGLGWCLCSIAGWQHLVLTLVCLAWLWLAVQHVFLLVNAADQAAAPGNAR